MKTLTIHPSDNVAVCLEAQGEIPAGHKLALRDIAAGEQVIKYGHAIGRAKEDIRAGEWVHTHNLRSGLDEDAAYSYNFRAETPPAETHTFLGFPRKGRRAGVRNDIFIIPSVGCVNGVCRRLAASAQKYISGTIDGIWALEHPFGCSQLGQDQINLIELLTSLARNPNASFVLFVGLGCENTRLDSLREALQDCDHVAYLCCQDETDEHAAGLAILKDFAERAAVLKREAVSLAELCIGLKCGGSDGFSGITANPTVGRVSDRVVASGGSAVLTEVPEMFGAEQVLMDKCASEEVFRRYCGMIERFKQSYRDQGFPIYENPSPGNREGGITTLEEKSLGCVEKAGRTAVVDVLGYGARVQKPGVSVLNGPGNDLIAATALAAAGCQLVLFTTGRGTPFATCVPTLKISTNAALAAKKSGWIDFDASGSDDAGLFKLVLRCADGAYRCKSEDSREIAFYKTGVTL